MSDSRSGFADLGLPEVLLAAIARQGFQEPSPIQAQAIP
ncbi:MAG: DEAD/DEAH box helicase, partial [Alcanivorax sp.]